MIEVLQVTVTPAATHLYTASGKAKVRLQPDFAFYLGHSSAVTVSDGYSVTGGVPAFDRVFELEAGDSLYGIMQGGSTADVRILAIS